MSLSTHNNINFTNELANRFSKKTDSTLESYILKKQIELSLNNNFINFSDNTPNLLPMKLRSQFEELQKLQSEVNYIEKQVKELGLAKQVKQIKVTTN
jgi:hypothetical protein